MHAATVRSYVNLQQVVTTEHGAIITDEAREVGGDGLGLEPYDLLLGALGSCTSMTLLLYARRKGWPLESVEVRLEHERIPASACEECPGEARSGDASAEVQRIRVHVALAGPLSATQETRLREVARRCPVFRTLTAPPRIVHTFSVNAATAAVGK